jgi:hypothetical protein
MNEVSLPNLPADAIDHAELVSMVIELLNNRPGVVKSLELARRKLRAKAETNFGMLNLLR